MRSSESDTEKTKVGEASVTKHTGGVVLLSLAAFLFVLFMIAGVIGSIMGHGWLPDTNFEYTTELNRIVQQHGRLAALPEIRVAAMIDFDNAEVQKVLFETARAAGEQDDALKALFTLTRIKPEDGESRNLLVVALLERGRFADAYSQGRFAVWLSPNSPEAHYNLGAAFLGLGHRQQAAAAFNYALELNPTFEQARRGLETAMQGR